MSLPISPSSNSTVMVSFFSFIDLMCPGKYCPLCSGAVSPYHIADTESPIWNPRVWSWDLKTFTFFRCGGTAVDLPFFFRLRVVVFPDLGAGGFKPNAFLATCFLLRPAGQSERVGSLGGSQECGDQS